MTPGGLEFRPIELAHILAGMAKVADFFSGTSTLAASLPKSEFLTEVVLKFSLVRILFKSRVQIMPIW